MISDSKCKHKHLIVCYGALQVNRHLRRSHAVYTRKVQHSDSLLLWPVVVSGVVAVVRREVVVHSNYFGNFGRYERDCHCDSKVRHYKELLLYS